MGDLVLKLQQVKQMLDLGLIPEQEFNDLKSQAIKAIDSSNSQPIIKLQQVKELLDLQLISNLEYEVVKAKVISQMGFSTSPPVNSAQTVSGENAPSADPFSSANQTMVVASPQSNPFVQSTPFGNPSDPFSSANQTMVGNSPSMSSSDLFSEASLKIGQYTTIKKLGVGGMGAVYLGRHNNEDFARQRGDVALKLIKSEFAQDESFRKRFIREAAVGSNLTHTNIAKVYDLIDTPEYLGFVMEFVEGTELSDLIGQEGMELSQALALLRPLASALDYLHSQKVVHRDFKPDNVRILPNGIPKLLDFGIASVEKDGSNTRMTQALSSMGTPVYMAPEQAIDAQSAGPAADRYAFGLVVYELLCGSLPWPDKMIAQGIIGLKLTGQLTPLSDKEANFAGHVSTTIMKMLSIHPEDRFANCRQFLDALEGENTDVEDESILEQYQAFLARVLADGIINEREKRQMQAVRVNLGISDSTHERMMSPYRSDKDARISLKISEDSITSTRLFNEETIRLIVENVSVNMYDIEEMSYVYRCLQEGGVKQGISAHNIIHNETKSMPISFCFDAFTTYAIYIGIRILDMMGTTFFYQVGPIPLSVDTFGLHPDRWEHTLMTSLGEGIWSIPVRTSSEEVWNAFQQEVIQPQEHISLARKKALDFQKENALRLAQEKAVQEEQRREEEHRNALQNFNDKKSQWLTVLSNVDGLKQSLATLEQKRAEISERFQLEYSTSEAQVSTLLRSLEENKERRKNQLQALENSAAQTKIEYGQIQQQHTQRLLEFTRSLDSSSKESLFQTQEMIDLQKKLQDHRQKIMTLKQIEGSMDFGQIKQIIQGKGYIELEQQIKNSCDVAQNQDGLLDAKNNERRIQIEKVDSLFLQMRQPLEQELADIAKQLEKTNAEIAELGSKMFGFLVREQKQKALIRLQDLLSDENRLKRQMDNISSEKDQKIAQIHATTEDEISILVKDLLKQRELEKTKVDVVLRTTLEQEEGIYKKIQLELDNEKTKIEASISKTKLSQESLVDAFRIELAQEAEVVHARMQGLEQAIYKAQDTHRQKNLEENELLQKSKNDHESRIALMESDKTKHLSALTQEYESVQRSIHMVYEENYPLIEELFSLWGRFRMDSSPGIFLSLLQAKPDVLSQDEELCIALKNLLENDSTLKETYVDVYNKAKEIKPDLFAFNGLNKIRDFLKKNPTKHYTLTSTIQPKLTLSKNTQKVIQKLSFDTLIHEITQLMRQKGSRDVPNSKNVETILQVYCGTIFEIVMESDSPLSKFSSLKSGALQLHKIGVFKKKVSSSNSMDKLVFTASRSHKVTISEFIKRKADLQNDISSFAWERDVLANAHWVLLAQKSSWEGVSTQRRLAFMTHLISGCALQDVLLTIHHFWDAWFRELYINEYVSSPLGEFSIYEYSGSDSVPYRRPRLDSSLFS